MDWDAQPSCDVRTTAADKLTSVLGVLASAAAIKSSIVYQYMSHLCFLNIINK